MFAAERAFVFLDEFSDVFRNGSKCFEALGRFQVEERTSVELTRTIP